MEYTLRCAISNCCSNSVEVTDTTETVLYFPFPEDSARCAQWVKASGLEELFGSEFDSKFMSENYALCGRHFDESSFFQGIENCLLEDAVPMLFPKTMEEAAEDDGEPEYVYVHSNESETIASGSQIYYLQLIDQSNGISHNMQITELNEDEFDSNDMCSQSTDEIHLLPEIQMCSDSIPEAGIDLELANRIQIRAIREISELAQTAEFDVAEGQSSSPLKDESSTFPGNILYTLLKDTNLKKETVKFGNGVKIASKAQKALPQGKPKKKMRQDRSKAVKSAGSQNRPSGGILPKRTQREIELQREVRKYRARVSRWSEKLSRAEAEVERVETEFRNFKSINPVYPDTVKKFADLFKPCRGGKGAKYSEEIKQFALTLDAINSKVYSFLSEFVPLPSKRLLQIMRAKGELGFTE